MSAAVNETKLAYCTSPKSISANIGAGGDDLLVTR